jgi:hypothetical protein
LSTNPPEVDLQKYKINNDYFCCELLISLGYILDTESDDYFHKNSRLWSYQRKPWPNTQFIHKSGIACVEILKNDAGFLWVKNRIYLANQATKFYSNSSAILPNPDNLCERLELFCKDKVGLQLFWDETRAKLIGDSFELKI